jgi:hypothetical protein
MEGFFHTDTEDILQINGIIGFENQFVELQERLYARIKVIGPIQAVGDQNEYQFGRDSLRESSDQEGHEVVPIPADVVRLIGQNDVLRGPDALSVQVLPGTGTAGEAHERNRDRRSTQSTIKKDIRIERIDP